MYLQKLIEAKEAAHVEGLRCVDVLQPGFSRQRKSSIAPLACDPACFRWLSCFFLSHYFGSGSIREPSLSQNSSQKPTQTCTSLRFIWRNLVEKRNSADAGTGQPGRDGRKRCYICHVEAVGIEIGKSLDLIQQYFVPFES